MRVHPAFRRQAVQLIKKRVSRFGGSGFAKTDSILVRRREIIDSTSGNE
jgi:hypothetical protein